MTFSLTSSRRKTDNLRSVPVLKDEERAAAQRDPYGSRELVQKPLKRIKGLPTQELRLLMSRTTTPLVLWAFHAELDTRGVPPCLRPHALELTEQNRFITTLADLLWIAKRHPGHVPLMARHRDVFADTVPSDRWHKAALYAYQAAAGLPHMLARNLALTDEQRRETLTLATKAQQTPRKALEKRQDDMRKELWAYALNHPDRAATRTPSELADRRMVMVQTFVALGRDSASTLAYLRDFEGITNADGNAIDRRTLRAHLEKAAQVCKARKLILG